jgi:hypothetical protein
VVLMARRYHRRAAAMAIEVHDPDARGRFSGALTVRVA